MLKEASLSIVEDVKNKKFLFVRNLRGILMICGLRIKTFCRIFCRENMLNAAIFIRQILGWKK